MKVSTILRRAAELAMEPTACPCGCGQTLYPSGCQAISHIAEGGNSEDQAHFYFNHFHPPGEGAGLFWWGIPCQENVLPRTLALLFAAELAASDGE
jgi:hypothetical protein